MKNKLFTPLFVFTKESTNKRCNMKPQIKNLQIFQNKQKFQYKYKILKHQKSSKTANKSNKIFSPISISSALFS